MSKYHVTHACGHGERVDLIGPTRSREWRIARMKEEICWDCRRAELRRQNEEAAKENQAAELPSLEGTGKQIPWAESIRAGILGKINWVLEGDDRDCKRLRDDPRFSAALDALYKETRAWWWIDNRALGPYTLLTTLLSQAQPPNASINHDAIIDAKAEATVRPPEPKTETVAEIRITGQTIGVLFPEKRADFRQLMRDLRYHWAETLWERTIQPYHGEVIDRTAEVGHRLLAARFSIRLFDADLRDRAINGTYAPEIRRWIRKRTEGPYEGWFVISWPRTEDYYRAAKRLRGSRYARGGVHVPAEQFEQVVDFAELFHFSLSPGATELVEQAKRVRDRTLVANVAEVQPESPAEVISRIPPKLDVPDEVTIDAALRDDEDLSDDHATA